MTSGRTRRNVLGGKCRNGHVFTEDNIIVGRNGSITCKQCSKDIKALERELTRAVRE